MFAGELSLVLGERGHYERSILPPMWTLCQKYITDEDIVFAEELYVTWPRRHCVRNTLCF